MTNGPVADPPRQRAGDQGRRGQVRAFWFQWGGLIQGAWLLIVSAAIFFVAIQFYASQSATEQAASTSCLRSVRFGPALAEAYARYHILDDRPGPNGQPSELDAYKASIPKSCP